MVDHRDHTSFDWIAMGDDLSEHMRLLCVMRGADFCKLLSEEASLVTTSFGSVGRPQWN